jgi:hypothetical protein
MGLGSAKDCCGGEAAEPKAAEPKRDTLGGLALVDARRPAMQLRCVGRCVPSLVGVRGCTVARGKVRLCVYVCVARCVDKEKASYAADRKAEPLMRPGLSFWASEGELRR